MPWLTWFLDKSQLLSAVGERLSWKNRHPNWTENLDCVQEIIITIGTTVCALKN
jgi:hypothetical protein